MNYLIEMNDYWSRIDLLETCFLPSGGLASVVDQETNTAYIYGGMSPGMVHNKLYRFDLNSEEFSVIDTLPIPDRINHRLYHTLDNNLVIVSGALINNVPNPETVEVLLYDIDTGDISVFDTKIPFRGQFGSSFDKEHDLLFLYNGFGNNDLHCIDVTRREVRALDIGQSECRAGMVCEYLKPNKLFVFSGFSSSNGKSVCHNDYKIIDTVSGTQETHELCEPFGRTFSKSMVIEDMQKILIFGGSPNGMESSGSFYFYDYVKDLFNVAYIQPLPGQRVEPAMMYSNRNKKVYIIGGFVPDGPSYKVHTDCMVLDIQKLPGEAWLGHP